MTRKRSVVWDYFNDVCPESVECLLCKNLLNKHEQGSTTGMWRHLRAQHPTEAAMAAKRESRGTSISSNHGQPLEIGEAQVEVELEDGNGDVATVDDDDIDSAMDTLLVAAQGEEPVKERPEEVVVVGEERPSSGKYHRRSLIWKRFEPLGSLNAAQCLICKKKIMCSEGKTSNLYRHMAKTHPQVNTRSGQAVNEAAVHSELNGILEAVQGESAGAGVAEKKCKEEKIMVENPLSFRSKCHRRSSIWKLFEPLGSLDVAQCLICKKRIRCPDGKTSNMHRHMSKSHPQAYRQAGKALKLTKTNSPSHSSNVQQETCPVEAMKGKIPDMVQVSKDTAAERRVFRRERELIEALRRTQREEAKALDHQRELVESLRAVNAREAAVEKKQIESLRRAQQEEAQDLMRQREELEREKTEQQKRWEELEQEKKQLLLLCQEPAAPTLVSHQQ
ncbi:uncharacterized protein LOC109526000 [Hippocampus comes]|uniref:Uncharacterized LOC109526000 n=1 Tax=Hippocampus comes TaxID=109280 RepID=A0A3Q2XSP1_HIPCM|nr:PREDICTED: uncharacterized protein LOC109526000 [Hippocampus comes]